MLFSSGNEISAVVTTAMCPIYFIVCFIVWFTLLHASVTIEDISEEHPWEKGTSFTDARKHFWSKNTHYTARTPSTQYSGILHLPTSNSLSITAKESCLATTEQQNRYTIWF